MSSPDYKEIQQELTELNADGNETRGRDGEDLREEESDSHSDNQSTSV